MISSSLFADEIAALHPAR